MTDTITVTGAAKGYRGRAVLHGVDLALREGRSLALIGESGAGKSTLLRLVLALEGPDEGTVAFRGEPVTPDAPGALRREVGVVVQDAGSSLDPRASVRDSLREPLEVQRFDADHDARISELLVAVGIDPDAAGRRPGTFSGGQRQRIALARALVANPSVLVVDEPFSAVDPSTRARLVRLVRGFCDRTGIQLLLVTHDLGVAERLCDDVVVLERGRVVEAGVLTDVFAHPGSAAAADLLDAVPRLPVPT